MENYKVYLGKAMSIENFKEYERQVLAVVDKDMKFLMQVDGLDMNPRAYFLMRAYQRANNFND